MTIQADAKKQSTLSQLIKNEPELVSFVKEGDLVEAKFLSKAPRAVYFDLGRFGTGVVCGFELSNVKDIIKGLETGQAVNARVVSFDSDDGLIELSLAGAHRQKEWQAVKEIMESGDVLSVKIVGANNGGLIAEISGLKAFLPVSQLANEHYPKAIGGERKEFVAELKKIVGQELKVKIIDANSKANKLIISEKEAAQEDVKKLLENYKTRGIVDVVVSGIASFGVFIRFSERPEIEGLIRVSELAHKIIDTPKEIVKLDEPLKAMIIEIKDGQVFLSLKALSPDPWQAIGKIKEGAEVSGVVYKFNPAGALINLEDDFQGVVGVSEFGGFEEMKKNLKIGEKYQFIVESVKPEERKISLKKKPL